jgi:HD-like signal output (HDOD) protein
MELQTLLQDQNVTARQLALVIKKDPLIAGNILQIANNLKTSGGKPIESLEHAVTYVGFKTLAEIILTASISSFKFNSKAFKADAFWRESFLTGLISEHLARRLNKTLIPDEVYLAGCLANVGKVVQAICLPDQSDAVSGALENPKDPKNWTNAEQAVKVYGHGILGEIAASLWGLPGYVVSVTASHHNPKAITPRGSLPTVEEIVKFGNQLTHWILFQPTRMEQPVYERCLERFQMKEYDIEKMVDDLMPLKANVEKMTVGT